MYALSPTFAILITIVVGITLLLFQNSSFLVKVSTSQTLIPKRTVFKSIQNMNTKIAFGRRPERLSISLPTATYNAIKLLSREHDASLSTIIGLMLVRDLNLESLVADGWKIYAEHPDTGEIRTIASPEKLPKYADSFEPKTSLV